MTTNNPKYRPLHRVRQARNAERAASLFPQLAAPLFLPSVSASLDLRVYAPDPTGASARTGGGLRAAAPRHMGPQPTMTQFYAERTGSLQPRPRPAPASFLPAAAGDAQQPQQHQHQGHPPGFVTVVRNGPNQFCRMLAAGLDVRVAPTPEQVRRRAELEERVQRCREGISAQTIVDESRSGVEGRKRAVTEPFPMWREMVRRDMAQRKEREKNGNKAEEGEVGRDNEPEKLVEEAVEEDEEDIIV